MNSFTDLLNQGATHAWLFIPTAIALGALHGLEPGHSKTMMAAFIVAIRGTVGQAVLLGLSAAFSHSLVIWALAAAALHYGSKWNAETSEPYFQIASGIMIGGLAMWMFWRTRREQKLAADHDHHAKEGGPHGGQLVDTGHGFLEVEVFETGVPPRFRLHALDAQMKPRQISATTSLKIETRRDGGAVQTFSFARKTDAATSQSYFESREEIPEPHAFTAVLTLAHGDHSHVHEIVFTEGEHHHHHHSDLEDLTAGDYADAHERAHAADIAKRFVNRTVTTPQIVWFGITGGLMPCPAAFTVLLICLQLKKYSLGFTLVGCFSLGLALTMVASGVLAAWGVRHAEKKIKNFGRFARRAPYFSSALLVVLAVYVTYQGWRHLPAS